MHVCRLLEDGYRPDVAAGILLLPQPLPSYVCPPCTRACVINCECFHTHVCRLLEEGYRPDVAAGILLLPQPQPSYAEGEGEESGLHHR